MAWGDVLALSVGLAMDATAVAASRGMAAGRVRPLEAATLSLLFGGFQASMPLVGWAGGSRIDVVVRHQHVVAALVFLALGLKALHEARGPAERVSGRPFAFGALLLLAVATSIDALAAGVTLPALGAPVAASVAAIGVTTAALSLAAVLLGRRLGTWGGKRLDVAGGLVLLGLAVKTLAAGLGAPGGAE